MPLPNPSMDFTPFDPLTAAELDDLVENDQALAAGTGLDNDAVADSKLVYGKVRSRQGGSATDWTVPGTTTYDYSGTNTFIQVGAITMNNTAGGDAVITFPTAFAQKPVVTALPITAVSVNQIAGINTVTNTGFKIRSTTSGGAGEIAIWIAIGQ